jgi:hypothetical protein
MSAESLQKLGLTLLGLGAAGYLALNLYSQPLATYRQIEPIRTFLRRALAHDSVALSTQAGDAQPVRWVLKAMRLDSAAVREWADSRPRVTSTYRGDTLWVTLRRPGSTDRCSPLYPLAAGFLERPEGLRLIHLSSSCPSEVFHASADCPERLLGSWEYRQSAGDRYDDEGERLELSCTGGSLQGLYSGLEREGEHGLFYTLVAMADLKIGPEGELSFTVPERELFHTRPKDSQEVGRKKLRSAGLTRDQLHMRGRIEAGAIILTCTSSSSSCPDSVMVFRKGTWSSRSRPLR